MNNNFKEVFKSKVVNNVHALNTVKISLPHRFLILQKKHWKLSVKPKDIL